jgi:uncharacterized RDD family membrane protein YckC
MALRTHTSEVQENFEMNLASRWARLGAALLDGIFLAALIVPTSYFMGVYDGVREPGYSPPMKTQILALTANIALFLILNGACIYNKGQTLGKLLLKIKVVSLDGKQLPGNKYVFIRYLPISIAGLIPVVGTWIVFIGIILIFRKEKNCLHDDLCGSRVITLKNQNK